LGSSFAFIGPVLAVIAGGGTVAQALGGVVAAGFIYALIGLLVQLTGAGWIDRLMPPLVTGAVVAIIGLNLANVARGMAAADPLVAIVTILVVFVVALRTGGLVGRLPILLGVVVGYLVTLLLRGVAPEGRTLLGTAGPGIDFSKVSAAAWLGVPHFQTPTFNWTAISLIAPVAIALVAENTGHIKAVGAMTGSNLMPYLGRGFIGDGVATMVAGLGGGSGVTTYAENIGVMAVTRVYSTAIFVVASLFAILLGLSPKFGALIQSIPLGVLGGVTTVLFGLIAATGARIWVDNKVDFSKGANLFIAATVLIIGAADYTLTFGRFSLNGITLGTLAAIVLYQIFGRGSNGDDYEFIGDDAIARSEHRR
ncbi:MAG: solute carrier family 23 protein, partial [Thermomicrobiales bacterium]